MRHPNATRSWCAVLTLGCAALAVVALDCVSNARADEEKPAAGGARQARITTANDEQISGNIAAVKDGVLTLSGDTPRTIPLADVQRIEFGKSAAAVDSDLAWIGQDNHDLVQVGSANGGNGVQDLHLHAKNLKALALKQVVVQCRFPKQLRVWRLDTTQSPHWRLAIQRKGEASEADFFLEPAAIDSFGQNFDVTYTYADGSTAKVSTTATTHTSDQTKVDKNAKPGAAVANAAPGKSGGKAEVIMIDAARLQGELVEMNRETLTLRTGWKGEVVIPLLRVRGMWMGIASPIGARSDFDTQLATPPPNDVVFVVAPDKSAAQVEGTVQGLAGGKLSLLFGDANRSINQERLLGLVFAAHPKVPSPAGAYQVFLLASGDSFPGHWVGLADDTLEIETLWQTRVKVPATELSEIRARNGRLAFLSDLEPASVEETPYFGRMIHWRADQGFDGEHAMVKGKRPSRCLAMHSHSVLTYSLDGQYDKFKATLGFDDSSANRGRAACRVLVDGREVFAAPDLRADQDPQAVEVSVAGAKQIALEVGFGETEDIGDRVIWAEPRLFRAE